MPGHTNCKDHKNGTNCLPVWHAMRQSRSLAMQPDFLEGQVVCGTVYGDMHLKVIHKSSLLYPGPGFLSSATWPSLPKKHYNGLSN